MSFSHHPAWRYSSLLGVLVAVNAVAQEAPLTRAEVNTLLAERDAVIIELQNTVVGLRQRLEALEDSGASDPPGVGGAVPDGALPPSIEATLETSNDAGRLTVDLDAAERALERTLVQSGALLLPRGSFEFVPTLSYASSDLERPILVRVDTSLQAAVARVARHSSSLNLAMRIGLPGDSQLEIGVPYLSVTEETTFRLDGAPFATSERTDRGGGIWQIGFAKTLMRETGWRPDIVGRITWGLGDGTVSNDGALISGGAEYVDSSLSFVKRRDPLALFLALGYTKPRERADLDPGDQYRISLGAALAVSPDSSVFGSLTYQSAAAPDIDGVQIAGADVDAALLNVGLSTILRRGSLLNIFTQFGISDDTPDYSVGFSLPTRW